MLISSLDFASLTQYCPKGGWGPRATEAYGWRESLKADKILPKAKIPASEKVAELLEQAIRDEPLRSFWDKTATLVPVPRSAQYRQDSLWVPWNIANAIVCRKLARDVVAALTRTQPVRQAHKSYGYKRVPIAHYETVSVTSMLVGESVILIDDFITSGATLLGCASKLLEVTPGLSIKAFAGARVMKWYSKVEEIFFPVVGSITLLSDGRTRRVP